MRQFDNEIILSAKIDDLDKLQDWMGVFLDGIKCPAKICSQIAVVTEEVFVNICSYAYPDKEGYVLARVKLSGPRLILQFEDSGKAFNPLEHEIPDVSAPLAGRDIGGLGIFLTRKWMDAITYDRINGKNQLTLHKSMKKIALIHGGTSTEQAVSTINAGHIEAALARQGYKTFMVTYNRDMVENLRSLAPDLAWVCVQGKGHGDGTVQSILDFMGIPYTGSRALGAQIINDKILCKELFKLAGIRTPDWRVISLGDYRSGKIDFSAFGYPFVAKAPTQGYSFGIELIESPGDLSKIDAVFAFDDPIYIEKFIP
ncbi:MAG: ATP-binding protein, partial [Treponema sp.]|nr:ATP-binding protein [Treponema sp.]